LLVLFGALLGGCGGSAPAQKPQSQANTARSGLQQSRPRRAARLPELAPAEVVRAMRSNEKKLRMCFFQAPLASGFVRVGWQVDPSGAVERVLVEQSSIDSRAVERCLAARVGELRFGELNRSAKGEWTYVFRLADPSSESRQKRRSGHDEASSKPGVILETTSPGSLNIGKVDEIVQAAYPLFARCYRDAIARNAGLSGWVGLRFVVNRSGRVVRVLDGGSDLDDPMALDCIAESIYALRFPKPRGGNAHVLYRMRLN
jgi:outer membrane biosynthesis protein TonB